MNHFHGFAYTDIKYSDTYLPRNPGTDILNRYSITNMHPGFLCWIGSHPWLPYQHWSYKCKMKKGYNCVTIDTGIRFINIPVYSLIFYKEYCIVFWD